MPSRSLPLGECRQLVDWMLCAVLVFVCAGANAAKRFEPYGEVSRNAQMSAELSEDLPPGKLHLSMICLDGYRFAVASIIGPSAAAPAVGMTQVYEAINGQVVPARCQ